MSGCALDAIRDGRRDATNAMEIAWKSVSLPITQRNRSVIDHRSASDVLRSQIFAKLLTIKAEIGMTDDALAERLGITPAEFVHRFYSPENYKISDVGEFCGAMGIEPDFKLIPRENTEEIET